MQLQADRARNALIGFKHPQSHSRMLFLGRNSRQNSSNLEDFAHRRIVAGSLVFTDKFKRYAWMSKPNSGFVHGGVDHKQRQVWV